VASGGDAAILEPSGVQDIIGEFEWNPVHLSAPKIEKGRSAGKILCYNLHVFVLQEPVMSIKSNRKPKTLRSGTSNPALTKPSKLASKATVHRGVQSVLSFAERQGLLRGGRTHVVRGRMPEALVSSAKARTGIRSDTKLLEAALANLAVADDYAEWLLSQRGTLPGDIRLEF
jgi:hypothetical protein